MALPRKLKNMLLFNDGGSYQGVVKTCTLPTLARKMEAFRGGGMNGPAFADLGLSDDGIKFEWKLGGLDLQVLKQWGAIRADGVPLRFAGAYQDDATGEVIGLEIQVRGRHETIEMGDAAPGEDTEHSVTTACTYYKLSVNGEEVIEIDVLNFIERVDGKDLLAEQRKALGLI